MDSASKFKLDSAEIYGVGVSFSEEKGNIIDHCPALLYKETRVGIIDEK